MEKLVDGVDLAPGDDRHRAACRPHYQIERLAGARLELDGIGPFRDLSERAVEIEEEGVCVRPRDVRKCHETQEVEEWAGGEAPIQTIKSTARQRLFDAVPPGVRTHARR
jgi:hypothetical protein